LNRQDNASDAEYKHYHAGPVDDAESADVAQPPGFAYIGSSSSAYELFAHEQEDEDDCEDGDTDGEDEEVSPARVCEIATDDGSDRVASIIVSMALSQFTIIPRYMSYLTPLIKDSTELFLEFSARVAPSDKMMRLRLIIPAAPKPWSARPRSNMPQD
jgi:hypothetical protein